MAEMDWYNTSTEETPKNSTPDRHSRTEVQGIKEPREKQNKRRTAAIIVFVFLLLVSTSYVFSLGEKKQQEPEPEISFPSWPPGSESGSGKDGEETPEQNGIPSVEEFEEFFEQYYINNDDDAPSSMPRAEIGVGPELMLQTAADQEEISWQEIYKKAIESVVSITAIPESEDGYYWGSGTIISADGYIVTNAHMIAGTKSATVTTYSGDEYEATLVGRDNDSDLAVLKIDATGLEAADFGISDELSVGEEIAAIGNPISPELIGTMTNGIVSAINRDVYVNGHMMTLLQTNAALNEGNSGGPVMNHYGQVVGIVNMKMASRYSDIPIEGIGFAIPSSGAVEVVNRIIKGQPGIGITVGTIPEDAKNEYALPDGLYVNKVDPRSDAYAKGIREGDVIIAANGAAVTEINELLELKNSLQIGDTIKLELFRKGKTFVAEVVLMNMNDLY